MFVQTVRIPVLEFFIAPIPGGGLGFLHPWKSEIATFRHRTLERGPKTVQHPAGLVLSEDIGSIQAYPSNEVGQVRRHRGNTKEVTAEKLLDP